MRKEKGWLSDLLNAEAEHYTCTGNRTLENGRDPETSLIPYATLLPLIVAKLGRLPADHGELIIQAERIIRETKRQ